MTTTINIEWVQHDQREQGREDSCWYTWSSEHDLVAYVSKGERTIAIHADGQMRIDAFLPVGLEYLHEGTIRYCDELEEFGILKDLDLWGLPDASHIRFDMVGPNSNGYYYVIDNNSWFDLYSEDGEHLDCVCHTLTEAIEQATKIINDDNDELWNELVNIKEIWNELRKGKDGDV